MEFRAKLSGHNSVIKDPPAAHAQPQDLVLSHFTGCAHFVHRCALLRRPKSGLRPSTPGSSTCAAALETPLETASADLRSRSIAQRAHEKLRGDKVMTLVRYEPWRLVNRLHQQLDHVFGDTFG